MTPETDKAAIIFGRWVAARSSTIALPENERIRVKTASLLDLAQLMDAAGISDRASTIRAEVSALLNLERRIGKRS